MIPASDYLSAKKWLCVFHSKIHPGCYELHIGDESGPEVSYQTCLAMAKRFLRDHGEEHGLECVDWVRAEKPRLGDLIWPRPVITRESVYRNGGFSLLEVVVLISILAIMAAMSVSMIYKAYRVDLARLYGTNIPPDKVEVTNVEDLRNGHLIYKTNYVIISGLEDNPTTELPSNYAILTNEWGGFSFRDGDGMIHPFWADGAWETEEKAIRAAWLSHSRRSKERDGRLRQPNYTVVRTNQIK
jgi:hypothetical protein